MWYTVFEKRTGRLVSVCREKADPLPAEYDATSHRLEPDIAQEMWDPGTLAYVPRPVRTTVDRVDDVLNDPRFPLLASLDRESIREILVDIFGRYRFRSASEVKRL